MVSARRIQAGLHGALIGLAIPYVWLNIGICACYPSSADRSDDHYRA